MAATVAELGPVSAQASTVRAGLPAAEVLPVEGVLPAELDGCLLQAWPHPAYPAGLDDRRTGSGSPLFCGVRLGGGLARRYLAKTTVRPGQPFGPVPALAPSMWLTDSAPDRPCHAAVARPVRDAAASLWHTIATYADFGYAEHVITGEDGTVVRAEAFALDGAPLVHAVALTERYVVVLDLPVTYSRAAALVGARLPYIWQPDRLARIGLWPRRPHAAVEPRWFPVDPCYVFHAVNAYDDGDRVVLDAVRQARAFSSRSRSGAQPSHVCRWTLDLTTGTASVRQLTDALDTAIVDDRVSGQRHRYVFGGMAGALIGHDLVTGRTQVRELGDGLRVGQPVFAPREGHGGVEGDGWILAVAEDFARRRTSLLVLNALDLDGPPQAVVRIPTGLPVSQRATWLPTA